MSCVLRKPKNNIIALEIIDFQNSQFGLQIESIVATIQDQIKAHQSIGKEVDDLTKLIFQRTGLKVDIIIDQALAAILPFYSNKHSIFIDEMFRGDFKIRDQEKILKKAQNKKGFVDLKNAKVGGLFSEYENLLYVNFANLTMGYAMTPAEITAVILHELGHAFSSCEYADRLETSNQILANVAKEILSAKKEKDLEYVYRELSKINKDITAEEVEILVNGNKVIAGYHWFKTIIGTGDGRSGVFGQLKDDKYDQTAFEQMADNFSARFGYGRPLITALEKLHDYFGNPEKSRAWNMFGFIMSLVTFVATSITIITLMTGGVILGAVYISLWLGAFLFLSGERCRDYTYDELKFRYQRLRNEQVARLKDLRLPKEQLKEIVSGIYFMDTVINQSYQTSNFFNKLSNLLFKTNRQAKGSIQEQQLLEQLAHNDLFLKAAELQTL